MAKARKSKRPRRPLDRESIERAALELIDQDGLGELSMRRLGQKLGVEAMSLYHHYPSKAHLLDALLERLIASLEPVPETLPWREQLWRVCHAYRALAARHPKFAPFIITHRMNTRPTLEWLERFVRVFALAGFDPESGARAFRTIAYYLMGAILDETSGYARGPTAAETVPEAEQATIAPTVTAYGPYFAQRYWDATFDAGLTTILDDLERQLGDLAAV